MADLTYEGAFDAYHTIHRYLRIFLGLPEVEKVEQDRLRIADFYLAFPESLKNFKGQRGDMKIRRLAINEIQISRYGLLPDEVTLFNRMESTQEAAFSTLAKAGYINGEQFSQGWIAPQIDAIPSSLKESCILSLQARPMLMAVQRSILTSYKLLGKGGLKDRSGLMDFRYDDR
ncbi:hypothetical protein N9W89_08540 [Hellea sp.]|nr:hypothetical protein [Hellea sp.]